MNSLYRPFTAEKLVQEMVRKEPNALNYLPYLSSMIDSSIGIIKYLGEEEYLWGDEPRFPTVRAELTPTNLLSSGGYFHSPAEGGRSLDVRVATLKALMEGAERYSLSLYEKEKLDFDSYNNLIYSKKQVVDPTLFISHDKTLNKEYSAYIKDSKMYWTTAWSWKNQDYILIPAQLVYLPYAFSDNEPVLRDPLTTGAAAGFTYGKAVMRGLLEVLERDATTIIHYCSLTRCRFNKIDLKKYPSIDWLIKEIEACDLKLDIYDYSLDLPVPIVAVRIMDTSGVGPAITVGSKASFDIVSAVEGALLEATCFRSPMRERMNHAKEIFKELINDYNKIISGELRAYLWLNREMQDKLEYLDKSTTFSSKFQDYKGFSCKNINNLIHSTIAKGQDILITDIGVREIDSFGIKVVKVIVPKLQPMHLDESNICWTERIHEFNSFGFNKIPHPFL
ncbi:YcaO-like family protein [Ectobacillus antri]|uniref:YcaO-like family protein n=1 Tax=Ectobacillus antri TaxID=2486280 RepID=UPI000F5A0A48|nr:YcaO-like family protein [Ectobacillus antri]